MASPPSAGATLHPVFEAPWEARHAAISGGTTFFMTSPPPWHPGASVGRWGDICQALPTCCHCPRRKLSSGKCRRYPAGPADHLVEGARHLRLEVGFDLIHLRQLGERPAAERAEVVDGGHPVGVHRGLLLL